jgi:hypothetical protein
MQMRSRRVLAAFTSVCLAATLAACGGATKNTAATSTTGSSTATTTKAAAPSAKLQPRNLDSAGATANPTIADYIKDQHISETAIHKGDPGAPQIDVQLPDGWQSASEDDTPDYAYGALVYTGPEAQGANYTPNIIALLSKLDGPVDQATLLQLAGGEMKNLPGFIPAGEESATVSGFQAYRIAGEYDLQGTKAASGQETIVIPAQQGLYVLQLNATSNEDQSKALFDALEAIDKSITITA